MTYFLILVPLRHKRYKKVFRVAVHERLMHRVSNLAIFITKRTRKLILSLYDYDRAAGDPCTGNTDCNCKSNVMYNSLFYLTCFQGGLQCNTSYYYDNNKAYGSWAPFGGSGSTVCGGFGSTPNYNETHLGNTAGDYCLSGGLSLHLQGKKRDNL